MTKYCAESALTSVGLQEDYGGLAIDFGPLYTSALYLMDL